MKSLPDKPDLEFLKKEAKSLRNSHRQGDVSCCEILRKYDTSYQAKSDTEILTKKFSINDAQRIIAREYGYTSWAILKRYIETLEFPDYHQVSDRRAYHRTITDSYDERSKNYDNSQWHRKVAIKTVDLCPPESGDRVLDIATGTGTIAFYAAKLVGPGGHVTGIDISKGMLNKCREKAEQLSSDKLEFIYADAEHLDFAPNSFDRIYCSSAFFWMSHPLATLRHWFELLSPGGYVGFNATPSTSFFWGHGARNALSKHGIKYNCNIPAGDPDNARELLELAGFTGFQLHEVEYGYFMALKDAKGPVLTLQNYAPGQHPHPLENVPEETMRLVQKDYETEIDKRATNKGVWHDMTQYYIYGKKP